MIRDVRTHCNNSSTAGYPDPAPKPEWWLRLLWWTHAGVAFFLLLPGILMAQDAAPLGIAAETWKIGTAALRPAISRVRTEEKVGVQLPVR